jgi:hypothetical protein
MSFVATDSAYFLFRTLLANSTARNIGLASRNLKVAIAVGVKPSFSNTLTITKELPQIVINKDIRKAWKGRIARPGMGKDFLFC